MSLRPAVLGAALVLSLASARTAAAVCSATDVMQCGATCWRCSGNTCTIGKLLDVSPATPGAPCTFDFGSRDIALVSGGFTGGSTPFEIRAHSLTVGTGGTLKASGALSAPGGIVTLTLGSGGFTLLRSANPIDVRGAATSAGPGGGGSVLIQSDGDVTLGDGIVADGTTTNGSGGVIMVTAGRLSGSTVVSSGNVTVTGLLTASGGGSGVGGTVSFAANGSNGAGNVDVENKVVAVGGVAGGAISIAATGDVVLGVNPNGGALLVADANGNGGCGGSIDVLAGGKVDGHGGVTSALSAQGSSSTEVGGGGGAGGTIGIEAREGTINLGGSGAGGVSADGGIDGCGGSVCVVTDTPGTSITTGVPISATAPGPLGLGGCIQLCSSGTALVHGDLDASGGCGGMAEVDALQALTVEPPTRSVHADAATGSGGCVMLSAGGAAAVSSLLKADTTGSLTGSAGGEIDVLGDASVLVNGPVDVSASGPNLGGIVDIEAGGDLTVGSAAAINADGGLSGGAGGSLSLIAGSPDLVGTLMLSGQAHANGTSTAGAASAELMGCTVTIGSTGSVDTRGDGQAANVIVARTALGTAVGAAISTTGGDPRSRNFIRVPAGSPMPDGTVFSPHLVPSDVTFAPVCTAPNPPANCLTPCPVCGNGVVEFPETCDNGSANGPCQSCGPTCRVADCNDNDPCTTDSCDPIAGCMNITIPNCTTTTTTLVTSTTAASTSSTASTTTTTVVATTSTTTATVTSSTIVSTTTVTSTTSTTSSSSTTPPTTTTTSTTTSTTRLTTTTTSSTTSTTSTTHPTTTTTTTTSTTSSTTTTTTSSSTTTTSRPPTTTTTVTTTTTTMRPTTTTASTTSSTTTSTTTTQPPTTTTSTSTTSTRPPTTSSSSTTHPTTTTTSTTTSTTGLTTTTTSSTTSTTSTTHPTTTTSTTSSTTTTTTSSSTTTTSRPPTTTTTVTTTTTTMRPTTTTSSTTSSTTTSTTTTQPPTTTTSTSTTSTRSPTTSTTIIPGNRPPDCSAAAARPAVLWPPNHQFADVSVGGVTDPDGDPIAVTITGITQDEALNGVGEGDTCPDATGVGTATASLRAEREGGGDGRVYHLSFTVDDGRGGRCTGTVTVCAPHDRGQGQVCVDQGPLVDSTGPTCVGACTGGCAIEMALARPLCTGENVPAALVQRLHSAQQDISQAAGMSGKKKAKWLMRKGIKALKQAAGIAATAAKKGEISYACAASVAKEFGGARSGADRWLRSR